MTGVGYGAPEVRAHPRLRRIVLQKARFVLGGVGLKLDDRPGDYYTDGVCTGAPEVRANPINYS